MATRFRRRRRSDDVGSETVISKESEFSFTLTRVAVAQICHSMGFKAAQQPALQALTDITTRYLQAIARLAAASANTNGRTESNLLDIVVALEDLASVRGFQGLSSVISPPSLYASAVVKDLIRFVRYTDEIPFAQPLPRWRNHHGSKGSKFMRCCDYDSGSRRHVPRWLPAMPEMGREDEAVETREREVKWGCFRDERNQEGSRKVVGSPDNSTTTELSALSSSSGKRGKVSFKIGVGGDGGGWKKEMVY